MPRPRRSAIATDPAGRSLPKIIGHVQQRVGAVGMANDADVDPLVLELDPGRIRPAAVGARGDHQRRLSLHVANDRRRVDFLMTLRKSLSALP
jgi:hypothetical protein